VIPLAAAFAAQTHGDARKAIDLMRVAGELAEREGDARVCEGHVRAAQAKVEKNRVLEVVRGISTQKKLCLYATAAVASQTADGTARSTTGYRVYQYPTDAIDADQYHQETYVNKMKELTTYSLVDFERRSHGPSSGCFSNFSSENGLKRFSKHSVRTLASRWFPRVRFNPSSKHRSETKRSWTKAPSGIRLSSRHPSIDVYSQSVISP